MLSLTAGMQAHQRSCRSARLWRGCIRQTTAHPKARGWFTGPSKHSLMRRPHRSSKAKSQCGIQFVQLCSEWYVKRVTWTFENGLLAGDYWPGISHWASSGCHLYTQWKLTRQLIFAPPVLHTAVWFLLNHNMRVSASCLQMRQYRKQSSSPRSNNK